MSRLALINASLPGILPVITAAIARMLDPGQIAGRVALVIACLCAYGCDTVDGGAVELSWKQRPVSSELSDKFVRCDFKRDYRCGRDDDGDGFEDVVSVGPISKMRLEWSVTTSDNQLVTGTDEWPCDDSHGVTGFDLPPGTALLSVKPICGKAPAEYLALPGSYIAPAAEQRRVTLGDTVSLGAVELVVEVSYCCDQSCICEELMQPITPSGT
jgi:hypothetical protein